MRHALLLVSLMLLTSVGQVSASDPPRVQWPKPLFVQLSALHSSQSWANVRFEDSRSALQMDGSAFTFDRVDFWGAELTLGLATKHVQLDVGLAYHTPIDGGFAGVPVAAYGRRAQIVRIHLTRWFAEAGFAPRLGDFTPFLLVQASMVRALVDIDSPTVLLRGYHWSFGTRVGLRAHVYKSLFLQAALYADLLRFPDRTLTLGFGVGRP